MKQRVKAILSSLGYEITKTRPAVLKDLFARHQFDCMVDVGANKGQFLSMARACGYRGPVVAFDPLAEYKEVIEKNGNVRVVTSAVGECAGKIEIKVYDDDDFSSRFNLNSVYGDRYGAPTLVENREVPVVDLDSSGIPGDRIFLKIDVQGSETLVLRGAASILKKVSVLWIEVPFLPIYDGAASSADVFALARQADLFPARFWGNSITETGAWVDGDVLFVRVPTH